MVFNIKTNMVIMEILKPLHILAKLWKMASDNRFTYEKEHGDLMWFVEVARWIYLRWQRAGRALPCRFCGLSALFGRLQKRLELIWLFCHMGKSMENHGNSWNMH